MGIAEDAVSNCGCQRLEEPLGRSLARALFGLPPVPGGWFCEEGGHIRICPQIIVRAVSTVREPVVCSTFALTVFPYRIASIVSRTVSIVSPLLPVLQGFFGGLTALTV